MPPLIQARPSNPMQSSLASHEWLRTRRRDACPKREATGSGTLPTTWSAVCLAGNSYGSKAIRSENPGRHRLPGRVLIE